MAFSQRYCPLCDRWMADSQCPTHSTPTVAESTILESETTTLDEGLTIAGRYRIGRLLGEGGMGAVYEAKEERMGRKVALKILTRSRLQDPVHLRRFYREARAAGSLEHPCIVRVYDFGVDDETGFPYIAMECLSGLPLNRFLERSGPLPEAHAARLVLQVAQALTEAHGKGIVHRDLKPENLIVRRLSDGSQQVKVLDFGVAKIRTLNDEQLQTLTTEGIPIGTPLYMSPEQARGTSTDFRSDLYALGFILYRILTGQAAMADANPLGTLIRQVVEEEPKLPKVLVDGTPPSAALIELYHDLVAKSPELRPTSTGDVVERLQALIRLAEATTLDETSPPRPAPSPSLVDDTLPPDHRPLTRPTRQVTLEAAPIDDEDALSVSETGEGPAATGGTPAIETRPDLDAVVDPTPSGFRMPLVAWVGVIGVIGVIALGLSVFPRYQKPSEEGTSPTQLESAQLGLQVPLPSQTVTPVPVGPSPGPAVPAIRTLRITSGPSGVPVFHGDIYIGETPLDYGVDPTKSPLELNFKPSGYRPVQRLVTDETLVHVALRRTVEPPSTNSKRVPPPTPVPSPVRTPPRAGAPSKAPAKAAPVDAGRTLPTW